MKQDNLLSLSRPKSSRRLRWGIPIAAVVVIGAAGGTWMAMHSNSNAAVTKPEGKDQEKKVDRYELASGDFAAIDARELRVVLPVSGALAALSQATVKSKVAGEVVETLVPEGVKVARGQVIVRLDTADLKAHLAVQQGAADEARARLALAQKNRESNSTLLQQKFISQNAFDTTQNSVELAQASLKSAESQVDIARRALEDAVVRAPIDGIISKRFVQPGEKAALDMPLFAMVNLSQLILEAQVPASEIPRVKTGQEVSFKVEGFQGRIFKGKVARINPAAEAGSRSMTVYVSVDNADGALRGGMFAKGGITLDKSAVTPLVPVTALRQDNGGSLVYKIEGGKIVAQWVKLGMRNDDEGYAEVTEGLQSGAQVLIVKLDGVKPGTAVKLPEAAPAKSVKPTAAASQKG